VRPLPGEHPVPPEQEASKPVPELQPVDRFTAVYREHHRQVYAYVVARAGRGLADEIVADTFVVVWRRFADVPQRTPLPWLLAVARNVVRERLRAEVRRQNFVTALRSAADENEFLVEDIADGVVDRAAVLAALATLSDADRDVLTLVAWHGLTPRQAAQVLDCSTVAYFVRLHRARRRFHDALSTSQPPRIARTRTKEPTR
jgi:RNA polymerase sigma-70 factor, ECF subfamily